MITFPFFSKISLLYEAGTVSIRYKSTLSKINRIYHLSLMQTQKSPPEGKRMMPETRFTEFRHYPLVQRLGFLDLHRGMIFVFLIYYWIKLYCFFDIFCSIYDVWRPTLNVIWSFSLRRVSVVCKQLTSLLHVASRVSYLSSWTRQNFPSPLKSEQTLSNR